MKWMMDCRDVEWWELNIMFGGMFKLGRGRCSLVRGQVQFGAMFNLNFKFGAMLNLNFKIGVMFKFKP